MNCRTVVALGAALWCVMASGCGGRPTGPADPIVVAIANSPVILDPRIGTDEYSQKAHQLLFSSLFKIAPDLRVIPELAESVRRPDDVTYEIGIRHGVRFHDGRELTAADVAYTFASFLDPKFGGRSGAYRAIVRSVTALEPYTVRFTLKQPSSSFLVNLVMGIVQDGSGQANVRNPIGSGPFKLAEFVPDDRLVLAPFQDYWGGAPRNPGIVMKVVPDDTMRGLELRKGSVDLVVNDLSPDIVWQLGAEGRLRTVTAAGTDYAYIGLNLRHPDLAKPEVRRAIGFAVNREAIVGYLRRGLGTSAVGIVPPMSWAFEPAVFAFRHDRDEAKRLLDAAGLRDPDGDGPATRLTLTIRTSTSEIYRLQAAAIQHDLADVGIRLDVRSTETQTLFADIVRGNFQLYTAVFVGVTDPDMLRRVFHSSQQPPVGLNRVHYVNAEVDRLIDAAAASQVEEERKALYGRAQRIIAADVPYLPLWYRTNVAVFQPDIEGVSLSPIADFAFLKDVRRVTAAAR
jgi:peptide/nickel transport system substrate-binding protein